jgi:hypothetical protein
MPAHRVQSTDRASPRAATVPRDRMRALAIEHVFVASTRSPPAAALAYAIATAYSDEDAHESMRPTGEARVQMARGQPVQPLGMSAGRTTTISPRLSRMAPGSPMRRSCNRAISCRSESLNRCELADILHSGSAVPKTGRHVVGACHRLELSAGRESRVCPDIRPSDKPVGRAARLPVGLGLMLLVQRSSASFMPF